MGESDNDFDYVFALEMLLFFIIIAIILHIFGLLIPFWLLIKHIL